MRRMSVVISKSRTDVDANRATMKLAEKIYTELTAHGIPVFATQ